MKSQLKIIVLFKYKIIVKNYSYDSNMEVSIRNYDFGSNIKITVSNHDFDSNIKT